MAQGSKERLKKHAKSLKEKLEVLDCPYVEGVDESWVIDVLFKPGEHRIRLLQWLFSKFDSSLENLLDPDFVSVDSKMDSRIQRLLFVASSLGLCHKEDAELIRGCGSVSDQLAFIEQLLDIVYIKDSSEDPQIRGINSPGVISKGTSVQEQFCSDCQFIDTLSDQEKLNLLLSSEAKFLPPDIKKQLDIEANKRTQKGEPSQLVLPEISRLQEAVNEMSKDLARQEDILAHLKHNYNQLEEDPQSTENVKCTLRLVLSELSQSLTGFSYCFDNEFREWCNQAPPQLNEIGQTFKRISGPLDHFTKMLSDVGTVKSTHKTLSLHMSEKAKTLINKMEKCSDGNTLVKDLEEYITVLEDLLRRAEVSFSTSETGAVMSDIIQFD